MATFSSCHNCFDTGQGSLQTAPAGLGAFVVLLLHVQSLTSYQLSFVGLCAGRWMSSKVCQMQGSSGAVGTSDGALQVESRGTHTSSTPSRSTYHNQPTMTIAYLWGRHLARHKKGTRGVQRSSAGRRPNDGRIFSRLHSCLSGSDVSSLNLSGPHTSCPLVAASSRSSSSGPLRRDVADPTLLCSVHPHLLCDLRLSPRDLQVRYAAFGESFRVHVTVFGVQQSLDFVQIRLCLSDIGLAGFRSGEMRKKKTSGQIAMSCWPAMQLKSPPTRRWRSAGMLGNSSCVKYCGRSAATEGAYTHMTV